MEPGLVFVAQGRSCFDDNLHLGDNPATPRPGKKFFWKKARLFYCSMSASARVHYGDLNLRLAAPLTISCFFLAQNCSPPEIDNSDPGMFDGEPNPGPG
jgi:hypothetical protein